MKDRICGIYCIENKVNGKKYIGKSINIQSRWKDHRNRLIHESFKIENAFLIRAWKKHGKNNFMFYIIEECSMSSLAEKEKFYISFFNTLCPNGYNLTEGGDGGCSGYHHTEETKKKFRKKKPFGFSEHLLGNKYAYGNKTNFGKKMPGSSSGYFGVTWLSTRGIWVAQVYINKKLKWIGSYKEEILAAQKYDEFVIANNLLNSLNFPENYYR